MTDRPAHALRALAEHRLGLYIIGYEKAGESREDAMAALAERDPYLAAAAEVLATPDPAPSSEGEAEDPPSGYSLVPTADLDRLRAVELAAREHLRGGEHEGPCDNDLDPHDSCTIHLKASEARAKALRAALGDRAAEGCGNCHHSPDDHSSRGAERCGVPWCECPGFLTVGDRAAEEDEDDQRIRVESGDHRGDEVGDRVAEEGR